MGLRKGAQRSAEAQTAPGTTLSCLSLATQSHAFRSHCWSYKCYIVMHASAGTCGTGTLAWALNSATPQNRNDFVTTFERCRAPRGLGFALSVKLGHRELSFASTAHRSLVMEQVLCRSRSRSRSRSRTSSEEQDLAPCAVCRAKMVAHPPGEDVQPDILAQWSLQVEPSSGSSTSHETASRLSDAVERASFFKLASSWLGEVGALEAGRSQLGKPLTRAHSRSELDRIGLDETLDLAEVLDLFEACPEPASPTTPPAALMKLARLGLSRASNQPREWWEEYL